MSLWHLGMPLLQYTSPHSRPWERQISQILCIFHQRLDDFLTYVVARIEQICFFSVSSKHNTIQFINRIIIIIFADNFQVRFPSAVTWVRFSLSTSVPLRMLTPPKAPQPITVAARSKAWTVFAHLNTGIVSSNPTQSMDACLCLFCVCVASTALRWADPPSDESYLLS
jgi:hypothetical protein